MSELVDYTRQLYDDQPDSMKALHPLKSRSVFEIAWEGGGRIISILAGEHKIRMYHRTCYVQEEAAFLPEAQVCYSAAHSVLSADNRHLNRCARLVCGSMRELAPRRIL